MLKHLLKHLSVFKVCPSNINFSVTKKHIYIVLVITLVAINACKFPTKGLHKQFILKVLFIINNIELLLNLMPLSDEINMHVYSIFEELLTPKNFFFAILLCTEPIHCSNNVSCQIAIFPS